MAAMQQRPHQMGMQPPQASPGHAPGHAQGPMSQQMGGQMAQGQMQNPAMKIPYPLLPHVHLKSHQLYPITRQLNLPSILQYLKDAPRSVTHLQPVEWTYLDPPSDGTMLLVWQAPGQVQYASDGYWWCDAERQSSQQHGNYNLEIYSHRCGYLPGETLATHARQRFRLTPNGPPNVAPCDPCLWIIRYFRADPEQHIPVSRVPQNTPMANVMQQRAQIEKAGRPVRKPFMLTDVANWPTLQVPEQLMRPRGSSQAMEDMHPAKRQRQEEGKDEEEVLETIEVNPPPAEDDDKDIFDILTPRDISIHRYTQHNEWMEELFVSPYAISNIKPASLGLGRGGALRKLTREFYQPVLDERLIRQPDKYTGGDDIAKEYSREDVQKFETSVQAYIAKTRAEGEKAMKLQERALAQLRDKSVFVEPEVRLRHAVLNEGGDDALEIESSSRFNYPTTAQRRKPERIDSIVAELTAKLNSRTKTEPKFRCVSKGGYLTPPPPPSPPAEVVDDAEDAAMADRESQFVDFDAAANGAAGGLSAQPHPDAAPQATKEDGGWVVLDRAAAQAGSATNGAPGPPAASSAAAAGTTDKAAADADDMLDFGPASGDDEGTPGSGMDGAQDTDFGASLDFGDLPEGEEDDGEDEGGDDDDDDEGDDNPDDENLEYDEGEEEGDDDVEPDEAGGPDETMDSAFADAFASQDQDQDNDEDASASARPPSLPQAGSSSGLEAPSTVAPEHQQAPPPPAEQQHAISAPSMTGPAQHEDVEMGEGEPQAPLPNPLAGAAGDSGEGEGDNGEGMEFDDSAFGDAFHHTEFEAGD